MTPQLHRLDTILRTAGALDRAVEELDRTHLRALAERLELNHQRPSADLQVAIRRRLLGLPRAR